jgi:hypothetical protein
MEVIGLEAIVCLDIQAYSMLCSLNNAVRNWTSTHKTHIANHIFCANTNDAAQLASVKCHVFCTLLMSC